MLEPRKIKREEIKFTDRKWKVSTFISTYHQDLNKDAPRKEKAGSWIAHLVGIQLPYMGSASYLHGKQMLPLLLYVVARSWWGKNFVLTSVLWFLLFSNFSNLCIAGGDTNVYSLFFFLCCTYILYHICLSWGLATLCSTEMLLFPVGYWCCNRWPSVFPWSNRVGGPVTAESPLWTSS